jgi:hypothetical protein
MDVMGGQRPTPLDSVSGAVLEAAPQAALAVRWLGLVLGAFGLLLAVLRLALAVAVGHVAPALGVVLERIVVGADLVVDVDVDAATYITIKTSSSYTGDATADNGTINGSSAAPGMTSTTTLTFYERGNGQVHKRILTAGENLVAGNICRLKALKYWKTDSDNATQVSGQLAIANATIAANATGEFYFPPCTIVSTGFPNSSICYLGPTAGGMVGTAPGTGKQVRIIGDTNGTTIFNFYPSPNWLEMA